MNEDPHARGHDRHHGLRGAALRAAGVACVLTAALGASAGCGRLAAPSATGTRLSAPISPAQALTLASRQERRITSLTMTETMTVHGGGAGMLGTTPGGGAGLPGGGFNFLISLRMRLKPTVLADARMSFAFGHHSMTIAEILTSRDVYLKLPGLPAHSGKPWLRISLATLPPGFNVLKMLNEPRNSNPFSAVGDPLAQSKLLKAASHLKVVGNSAVDGVPATEYSGSLSMASLLSLMPATERKTFGSASAGLKVDLPFQMWIDDQHYVRKFVLLITHQGASMTLTANVTSINQPVTIAAPPASQVSTASRFGG